MTLCCKPPSAPGLAIRTGVHHFPVINVVVHPQKCRVKERGTVNRVEEIGDRRWDRFNEKETENAHTCLTRIQNEMLLDKIPESENMDKML